MKAWLIDDTKSGIEQLRIGTVMDPEPGSGEVVVKVHYASLNPADRYLSMGQYPAKPSLPHILGRDGVGEVVAVATDVKSLKVGDRVLLLRSEIGVSKPGTFAELVSVPVESLAPVPPKWSPEQSAGAPLVYLTAYQALTTWGKLPPHSVVLITGASGGVGVASVQLAEAMGFDVVALSRSANKREKLERLGADHTIDPTDPAWPKTVKQILGHRRVELAVDNIGGESFKGIVETLGENGRISCVGQLAGPVPNFSPATLFFRRLRVGGVAVGAYTPAESQEAWKAVLELLEKSGAEPLVDEVFPFEQLPKAFAKLAAGPMGKVVLEIEARRHGGA
ncbi:quinone oxidoreductase family protein [Humisphaera borealis]|uniref:Zinc-binding alcohol dehydrogenase family protein n=1 Tax=Humisphaera borealis TaxID=2807512 RepID=A0A7M2WXT9_9BACT|nr:zinc-binding alcohol dehydrogenase family protein [Humisphaera borealis]QOV90032.1 zinc-binding alcohol dehydrogenase family protein [Humisphaera borealis]